MLGRYQQILFEGLNYKSAFFFNTQQQYIENLYFNFIIELAKQKGFNSLERSLNDLRRISMNYIKNIDKTKQEVAVEHMN